MATCWSKNSFHLESALWPKNSLTNHMFIFRICCLTTQVTVQTHGPVYRCLNGLSWNMSSSQAWNCSRCLETITKIQRWQEDTDKRQTSHPSLPFPPFPTGRIICKVSGANSCCTRIASNMPRGVKTAKTTNNWMATSKAAPNKPRIKPKDLKSVAAKYPSLNISQRESPALGQSKELRPSTNFLPKRAKIPFKKQHGGLAETSFLVTFFSCHVVCLELRRIAIHQNQPYYKR